MNALHITFTLFLVLVTSSLCWGRTPLTGTWNGGVQGPVIPVMAHISGTVGHYTVTLDSPIQTVFGIPGTISVSGNNVTIRIATHSPFSFTGTLSGSAITGTWSQSGQTGPLTLTQSSTPSSATAVGSVGAPGSGLTGLWDGDVHGPTLPLVAHISGSVGDYVATFDFPSQRNLGVPGTISVSGNNVTITIATPSHFSYKGTLSGSAITGYWSQGALSGALTLTRSGA